MNGDSEQKKEDVEVEGKPKSPAQEENNDETASSPNRWTSHVKQHTGLLVCLQLSWATDRIWKQILDNKNKRNLLRKVAYLLWGEAEPWLHLALCTSGTHLLTVTQLILCFICGTVSAAVVVTDAVLSLFRLSPDSPAEQHTHTYEEADNSISAETEPPAVESWKATNHHCSGPSAKDGGFSVWWHTALLAQQHCNTHPAFPTVSVTSMLMFWTLCAVMMSNQKAPILKRLVHYLSQQKGKLISVIVCGATRHSFVFWNVLFLLYDTRPVLDPRPVPLLLATSFFLPHELWLCSFILYVYWLSTFSALLTDIKAGLVWDVTLMILVGEMEPWRKVFADFVQPLLASVGLIFL